MRDFRSVGPTPERETERRGRKRAARSTRRVASTGLLALVLTLAPIAAAADDYDSIRAGHPLRVVAYVLHPVGFVLDRLIFKPAHWIGMKEPFKAVFGHEDRR